MSSRKKDFSKMITERLQENPEKEFLSQGIIPISTPIGSGDMMLYEIPMELIDIDEQIRTTYNPESIKELSQSIEQHGLINPIEVRRNGMRFTVSMGHRRYLATELLKKPKIQAMLRVGVDDSDVLIRQLVENIQREDLPPIDEVNAVMKIMEIRELNQHETAGLIGKSKSYVSEIVSIHKIFKKVRCTELEGLSRDALSKLSRVPDDLLEKSIEVLKSGVFNYDEKREFIASIKKGSVPDPDKIRRRKELSDMCNEIVTNVKGATDNIFRLKIRYDKDLTADVRIKLKVDIEREILNLRKAISAVFGDDVNIEVDLTLKQPHGIEFPGSSTIVSISSSLEKVSFCFIEYDSSKSKVIKIITEKIPTIQESIFDEYPLNEIIDQWNALPFQKIERNVDGFFYNALRKKFNLPKRYLDLKEGKQTVPGTDRSPGKFDKYQ